MVRWARAFLFASFVVFAALAPASAGRLRRVSLAASQDTTASPQGETCAALTNQGAFFTLDIAVGTPIGEAPAQIFSVVADTGSSNVIVASCLCHTQGDCYKPDRCFTGTEHSSTFHVQGAGTANVPAVTLSFGSGTINAFIASDVVRVGNLSATLEESLYLMYSHKLNFGGSFEGILGLGIPGKQIVDSSESAGSSSADSSSSGVGRITHSDQVAEQGIIRRIIDQLAKLPDPLWGTAQNQVAVERSEVATVGGPPETVAELRIKNFLEAAGVDRFSMCFNEQTDGVLRLGTPVLNNPLSSVGVVHWGLDFRGFRIGKTSKPLICALEDMRPNQEMPCGIIPDSGTTNILGPKKQVTVVLDAICDGWARCRDKFIASKAEGVSKKDVLQDLLADCNSWLSKAVGLLELPTLHLGVGGGNSASDLQTLELTGWSYVVEHSKESSTATPTKVCEHTFGEMEYSTEQSGPVWILGTSLFYTYRVDYDIATSPPSMSFTKLDDEPCTPCGKPAALMSQQGAAGTLRSMPRRVWGEPRGPVIDTTRAL